MKKPILNRRTFIELNTKGAVFSLFMPTFISQSMSSCKTVNESVYMNGIEDPNSMVDLLLEFTSTYKSYNASETEMREAACNKVQWKGRVRPIQGQDLFAGRMTQNPIGFIGQSDESSLGYYLHTNAVEQLKSDSKLTEDSRKVLEELVSYWEKENTVAKSKAAFTPEMNAALPSDLYFSESGIAFTLWRMSGIQFDYKKLVTLGIPGLKAEVGEKLNGVSKDSDAGRLYKAMLVALDTYCDVSRYYAEMARRQAEETRKSDRRRELEEMADILEKNTHSKPATFREGLQLIYLYNAFDGARNYGRMDDYLGDLYVADLDSGRIKEEEAIRLLSGIWHLMSDRNYRYDTRLIIGGKGRSHVANADQLALIIMETSNRVRDIVPQVALRFYKGQNPELYKKGLDIIGSGYTYPMLYNDDVNIPAVQKAFDVPYEEAIHAIQYGCGEYVLNHRSVGTPSGVINLLQAVLVTLNKGIDPVTGNSMGMPHDRYVKYNNFATFNDFISAYKEQVEYHVVPLALHEKLEYDFAGRDNPYLHTSLLMNDCIERGKAVFSGGVRYLGGTLESYGNSNAADSLVAIRELVYEKKILTLDQLSAILAADFKGYEKERKMMLACPKYGNDDEVADAMLTEIHEHLCNFTRDQKTNSGLNSYLIVVINNDANTVMGQFTHASPDGRKAYTYLNPGNNPVGGADKNGITAMLNSLVKPDPSIHAGAVQNMKFSRQMFIQHRRELEVLLATYFQNGGAQAMLTVISRGDLEEAIKHPENYQNLIVRVGGFSERFVNLPPETQQEILSRTLY